MPAKQSSSKQIEHANRPYVFEEYDTQWPQKFVTIAENITATLGEEIIEVEHVGSTSIPGMPSKPQIDVLVTVGNLNVIPSYYGAMQALGYITRGDYTNEGEEYFTKDDILGIREVSVHVLPEGHHWATELIDFRDYLRTHPDELKYYASTKREAQQTFPNDYTNYYKMKLPVIHELMKRAAEWHDRIYVIPS